MTNEELYNKMEQEFNGYKNSKLKDIKNYDFYGIAVRYELLEWVGSCLLESEDRQDEIELLKSKNNPLQYLYNRWLKTDDNLWDIFDDMLWYEVKWEKDHETN